jgi:hypothetical protein
LLKGGEGGLEVFKGERYGRNLRIGGASTGKNS